MLLFGKLFSAQIQWNQTNRLVLSDYLPCPWLLCLLLSFLSSPPSVWWIMLGPGTQGALLASLPFVSLLNKSRLCVVAANWSSAHFYLFFSLNYWTNVYFIVNLSFHWQCECFLRLAIFNSCSWLILRFIFSRVILMEIIWSLWLWFFSLLISCFARNTRPDRWSFLCCGSIWNYAILSNLFCVLNWKRLLLILSI